MMDFVALSETSGPPGQWLATTMPVEIGGFLGEFAEQSA